MTHFGSNILIRGKSSSPFIIPFPPIEMDGAGGASSQHFQGLAPEIASFLQDGLRVLPHPPRPPQVPNGSRGAPTPLPAPCRQAPPRGAPGRLRDGAASSGPQEDGYDRRLLRTDIDQGRLRFLRQGAQRVREGHRCPLVNPSRSS